MKRTIRLIVKWERKVNRKPVFHIHGDNDHTLPIRKIKYVDAMVKGGSHMMTLTKAEAISNIINSVLD